MPFSAIWAGVYALQRKKDKNYVSELGMCAGVYVIIAVLIYFLPQILNHFSSKKLDDFDMLIVSSGFNNIIPFTTPLIWAACYGIAAFLAHADKNSESVSNKIITSPKNFEPLTGIETPALIKRAFIFMSDDNFNEAERYIEQALKQDPENSQAYLGKLMTDLKIHNTDELIKLSTPLKEQKLFQRALSFANDEEKNQLESYIEAQNKFIEAQKQEQAEQEQKRLDNAKKTRKITLLILAIVAGLVIIAVCIPMYEKYQERSAIERRDQRIINERNEREKSKIEALRLELEGKN